MTTSDHAHTRTGVGATRAGQPEPMSTGEVLTDAQRAELDYFYTGDYRYPESGDASYHQAVREHHLRQHPGPVVTTSSKPELHAHLAHTGQLPFPRSAADLDMARLSQITAEHGFAVFDPATAGGFRELTGDERALLDREAARELVPDSGQGPVADHLDVVDARGQNPGFPYVPSAEFNDAAYREPRSDAEAAARTAWLDHQHQQLDGPAPERGLVERDEIEAALVDAEIDAHYSALAHDGDPGPAQRVAALEALRELRPAPAPLEHELDAELADEIGDAPGEVEQVGEVGTSPDDPGVALEDAWFRSSLDDVVPADAPDREAVIDRAVDHARSRFLDHGEITDPEQALAASAHQPDPEHAEHGEVDVPELDDDEPEA